MSRGGIAALLGLLVVAAGLGGCGEDDEPAVTPPPSATTPAGPPGEIDLKVVYDDGTGGAPVTGELVCRDGDARASGALYAGRAAAPLCAKVRELAKLLTTQPDEDQMCTQIYGGPQTARVTGMIDGKRVDRRFKRNNGCEIADFTEAAELLQP